MAPRRKPFPSARRGAVRSSSALEAALTPPVRSALETALSQTIAREWGIHAVPRRAVRQLADAWEQEWREREGRAPKFRPRRKRPPKAITVRDIARQFGDAKPAIDFAKGAHIPPEEWAEDLADEFDLDVHAIYNAYYVTDPAEAA